MKIQSIIALLFILPFASWAQFSNASDQLEFNNVAFHSDANVHGDGYQSSSLNTNFSYLGFNSLYAANYQGALRFQQSIGKWKFGFQANYFNLIQFQKNVEVGLSLAKDFAINRNWSIRPALGANALSSSFPYSNGTDMKQIYDINTGLQIRYKGWQLFGGLNAAYTTKDSIQINDTIFVVYQRQPHANIGLKKTFQIDSLRQIDATLFYENYQGFGYMNASVVFKKQNELFLLGYASRQLNLGCGLILPNRQQVMISFNLQQFSILQKEFRPGFQLNYKWQLMQRPSRPHFTGTPSF